MIDERNYEVWLVRYADGELTEAERHAVEAWLESHPDANEELLLYNASPRLAADDSIRYEGALPTDRKQWNILPVVLHWAAAAVVVVLLMLPAMRIVIPHVESENTTEVAVVETIPVVDTVATQPTIKPKRNIVRHTSPQESLPEPIVEEVQEMPVAIEDEQPLIAIADIPETEPLLDTMPTIAAMPEPNLIVYDTLAPTTKSSDAGLLSLSSAAHIYFAVSNIITNIIPL